VGSIVEFAVRISAARNLALDADLKALKSPGRAVDVAFAHVRSGEGGFASIANYFPVRACSGLMNGIVEDIA
jgi:hypothetical protein